MSRYSNSSVGIVSILPSIAFVMSIVGGVLLPVLGSVLAILISAIASRKAKERNDHSGLRLSSQGLLFGYAGLAFWIVLLSVFIIITRH
jgi:hypothetical protein